ncbi:hypothetical protein F5Y18DRAFT_384669 [Xylariaceae sp. FL1019]|nr:hypothetical protein F5Y18DRAFT_384669 [Xylariaceae sp. FL1019]
MSRLEAIICFFPSQLAFRCMTTMFCVETLFCRREKRQCTQTEYSPGCLHEYGNKQPILSLGKGLMSDYSAVMSLANSSKPYY